MITRVYHLIKSLSIIIIGRSVGITDVGLFFVFALTKKKENKHKLVLL